MLALVLSVDFGASRVPGARVLLHPDLRRSATVRERVVRMSTVTNYGWTRRFPATVPPPLQAASMAYDAAVGNVVLFGGLGLRDLLNDTWMWDGRTWIHQKPASSPPARVSASMAYDAARGKLVLFGGTGEHETRENGLQLNDTWTWDGTTWTKQHPVTAPAAGYAVRMAYDAAQHSMVLFSTVIHKALNVAAWKAERPTGTLETWTR
jgi:hypothetical protein